MWLTRELKLLSSPVVQSQVLYKQLYPFKLSCLPKRKPQWNRFLTQLYEIKLNNREIMNAIQISQQLPRKKAACYYNVPQFCSHCLLYQLAVAT